VHDNRVMRGPAFDFVDARDRFSIQRIGRQPINRLGRQGHDFPDAQ
jgi:hypothetical protein